MMKLAKSLKICLTTSNFAPTPLALKCCATNTQLSAYLMHKYESFTEEYEGSPKFYTAAKCLGLQNCQEERKIWVLNGSLQLDED